MEKTTNTAKVTKWAPVNCNGIECCPECGEPVEYDYEWLGEDETAQGWFYVTVSCPECWSGHCQYKQPE